MRPIEIATHPLPADASGEVYLRPYPILDGPAAVVRVAAGLARPLAGDATRGFESVELVRRTADRITAAVLPFGDLPETCLPVLDRLSAPREALRPDAGRPAVMGIVNVTPDSFSDGGAHLDRAAAIGHGRALAAAGADILDVGGESTRPGAAPVDVAEELDRVIPVVEGLAPLGLPVSIDTRKPAVMRAAVAAGAALINDVTALGHAPEGLETAAALGVPVVLMHMGGTPETMQHDPRYDHPLLDLYDYLAGRIDAAVAAGIPRARLRVDPGIGFGKTDAHNLAILARLEMLHGLGVPIVLGVSRKSLIGRLSRGETASARLPGSLAIAVDAVRRGVQVLRVHDVAETVQALRLAEAIRRGTPSLTTPDRV